MIHAVRQKVMAMTIKEIRSMTGLSQVRFGQKYHIPAHTIEMWEMGKRNPPAYVFELLERAVRQDIEAEGKQTEANEKQNEADGSKVEV